MIKRVYQIIAAGCLVLALTSAKAESQVLYAVDHNITPNLFTIDPLTGAILTDLGLISATGYTVAGTRCLATDPTDGTLYAVLYAADAQFPATEGHLLVTLNTTSAFGTPIALLAQGIRDITFDASGQLYGVSGGPNQSSLPDRLFAVDKGTGDLTELALVGTTGSNPRNHGLAFRPSRPGLLYHRYGMTGFETIEINSPHTRTEIGTNNLGMLISSTLVYDNDAEIFRTGETPGGAGVPYSWITLDAVGLKGDSGHILSQILFGYAFDLEGTLGDPLIFTDGFEDGSTSNWDSGLN